MTKKESRIVLLSITLCWASSYIFIKDVPQDFSVYAYLTLTSGVAGIILSALFFRQMRYVTRRTLLYSFILALLIAGNMFFEKLALDSLPASSVSTIASLNIVVVPLIMALRRQFPTRNNVAGIVIILLGICLSTSFSLQSNGLLGIIYVTISCIMMSLYIVLAQDYTRVSSPLLLTVLQLCFTALIGLVLWVMADAGSFTTIEWSAQTISYILILAFFSKAYAYIMLMYGEKYADAISVTVIASTEPIVTILLALIIPNTSGNTELFSARSLLSACIIAVGAVVAGTDFLSKDKKKSDQDHDSISEKTSLEDRADPDPQTPDGGREVGKRSQLPALCLLLACAFAVLSLSINVFEFADGYSEIRPENLFPVVGGLLLGPAGALACAVGNLLGDLYWIRDYGMTSIFGFAANFMAALIPYIIWRSFSDEPPNSHSWKNLGLFVFSSFLGNLACAWILNIGTQVSAGFWYKSLMQTIFFNNTIFSIAFGLPLFIILTSEKSWTYKRNLQKHTRDVSRIMILLNTALLSIYFVCNARGLNLCTGFFMKLFTIVTAFCLIAGCIIPFALCIISEKTNDYTIKGE